MITLAEAKTHLRVVHNQDDTYIQALIDAAEEHVETRLAGGLLPSETPAAVKAATLILVGDLYENRERHFDRIHYENRTFDMLLAPYVCHEVL